MNGQRARVGSRVKHFGERYTGGATATVVGFCTDRSGAYRQQPWIKVLINPDAPESAFGRQGLEHGWDWDRTELVGQSAAPDGQAR